MSAAKPSASSASGAAEVDRVLEAAIGKSMDELAGVEPGRLVSLSVTLSPALVAVDAALGGDSRWLAPGQGLAMYGSGAAARFESEAAERFRSEGKRWRLLGAATDIPLAFFTAAAATTPAAPTLWVPTALVRRSPEGLVVTLSAWRDAAPPQQIARSWRHEAARVFAPEVGGARVPNEIRGVTTTPADEQWRQRVRAATLAIAAGRFAKVVLARRLDIHLANAVDAADLADRLAAIHPECHVFSLPHGRGWVVAASPEQLAAKRGRQLVSHALAGTAKRHGRPDEDARAAAALLCSTKERSEHALVVDSIAAQMAQICDAVEHPQTPAVMPLRFVQHLWTPVSGRLRDGFGLLDAVARLHPTPAVLGIPRQAASDWLAEVGERRDGLYSGIAGWIDGNGDGEAVVILRSAYVEDGNAVLWAGAGIMADSDPAAEMAETELKLATMLEVLNAP